MIRKGIVMKLLGGIVVPAMLVAGLTVNAPPAVAAGTTAPTATQSTVSLPVGSATINGQVTLQGGSRPVACRVLPVTLKLFTPGASNGDLANGIGSLATFDVSTVDTGTNAVSFNIGGITAGRYDITFVSPRALLNVMKNVTLSVGSNSLNLGTSLEGDSNNDGIINALDFSILAASYLKSAGQAGCDARADYDMNGTVTALDFSMLAANYLKMSPMVTMSPPMVSSTLPANVGTGVTINSAMTAVFSKAMNPTTITAATFTLQQGITPVAGAVTYAGVTATFTPEVNLALNTEYTATITAGAQDMAGNALASDFTWIFTTVAALGPNPTAPTLGETARFVILASQAITTTTGSHIANGDLGIIDMARSFYAGFTPGASPGQFVELANGLSYAHDDAPPFTYPAPYASTIAFIDQVRTDLGAADTFLAADPNPGAPTQVCPPQLGGITLTRGVYKTASNVLLTTGPLHLDAQGDPNSVFIFSIGGTFDMGAPSGAIILDNGAQAKNIYFRTAGETVIEAGKTFYGNVFAVTQVRVLTGANVTGRLFGRTAQVTLDADTVTKAP